jgi:AcrR family transcriptional regulator
MATIRKQKRDRRIQRTERQLHEALSTLIREKPYDSIAVKEILARADVGRSTFYTHFRDKDELLVSGIHDMLRSSRSTTETERARRGDPLWFSAPFFAHIEQHRRTSTARMGASGRSVIHGHLEQAIAQLVAAELEREPRPANGSRRVPADLLARHVAATFVLVLNWWVDTESALSAAEIDDHFRMMVAPQFVDSPAAGHCLG